MVQPFPGLACDARGFGEDAPVWLMPASASAVLINLLSGQAVYPPQNDVTVQASTDDVYIALLVYLIVGLLY